MSDSTKEIAYEKHEENKGWFHHSRELSTLFLKERNNIFHESKFNDGYDECLKEE